jgi:hypothetical protein
MMRRGVRSIPVLLFLVLAVARCAFAQPQEPIGRFAVDMRGAFARHKAEPSVATDLGVTAANLPSRTLGLVAGAHVYPLHLGKVITLGFGGNVVVARGSQSIEITNADKTTTKSPIVRRHFTTVSPEISLNFGHRTGWSYISGGMFGRSKLFVDRADAPAANAPYKGSVNYGGGARWFTSDHVAFSVDFRWYSVAERAAAPGLVAQPRTTLLVLSGGISLK